MVSVANSNRLLHYSLVVVPLFLFVLLLVLLETLHQSTRGVAAVDDEDYDDGVVHEKRTCWKKD